jgi:hypothetical protein
VVLGNWAVEVMLVRTSVVVLAGSKVDISVAVVVSCISVVVPEDGTTVTVEVVVAGACVVTVVVVLVVSNV